MANQEYLTWEEFGSMLDTLTEGAREIHASHTIDRVVGISRGGLPIGVVLSHRLGVPFTPVEVKSYGEDRKQGDIQCDTPEEVLTRCKGHVLLVDDLADSGKTSDYLMSRLKALTQPEVTIATLYYKPTSIVRPQLYVKETSSWIIFPWEG
ncbi:phosphoribosyltransferase [Rubellicoccus peritrichatus]|uniref:Phosphoribosyltransferase family protein n=1 Tax=Rubellicoccus peritrichatus TaxID=3080537 RepID=A0AAQ3LEW2_9BACT|nr:phosphoribosyltransferase family protein [Puniceicoccus sp. CR14]WOO40654.1 phosphoribosyltransferase family protein [Puniceicoccus sp. CR14]